MAWLPVIAPSARTGSSCCSNSHKLERAAASERVLDRERAAQPKDIVGAVRALDSVETAGRSGNHDTKIRHERIP